MKIEKLKNCTGCNACYSACSKNAITMIQNHEGFLYPAIDNKKCVVCNVCETVCPVLNIEEKTKEETKAYSVIIKDELKRMESSSGGAFTAISENILKEGGVIFGARFADNFSVIHEECNSIENLEKYRGSKYVQSYIGNCFKECKNILEQGKKVLFTGTPCQIAGLRRYLKKDYSNLLTADLVCHGVPSPLLWQKYIQYREKKSNSKIVKISFRRKDDGWKLYSLAFTFENSYEYRFNRHNPFQKDCYMRMFIDNRCLRESCYECPFKGIKRNSDITIADFWGIEKIRPELNDDKGISLVITHSEKGNDALKKISDSCICNSFEIEKAIKDNPYAQKSVKRPADRDFFFMDLNNLPFSKIIKKYGAIPFYKNFYYSIRWNLGIIKKKILKTINYTKD